VSDCTTPTYLDTARGTGHTVPKYQYPGSSATSWAGKLDVLYNVTHPSLLLQIQTNLLGIPFSSLPKKSRGHNLLPYKPASFCQTSDKPAAANGSFGSHPLQTLLLFSIHRTEQICKSDFGSSNSTGNQSFLNLTVTRNMLLSISPIPPMKLWH
jgi:hypothetical protein